MCVRVKKNYLTFRDYQFQCSIGKSGFSKNKKEGDGFTPVGTFYIERIYYRADKISNLVTKINKVKIHERDGWCDDPRQKEYNQLIEFPFNFSAEKLYREDSLYNVVCVLNYNTNPITPGLGSAIFIHVVKDDYKPTEGCVALKQKDLIYLLSFIDNKTKIILGD
jgi:L,D-peptidoglycan transpeptidase YkuD (ErfK/YbiS/YcfS/YnhG family)